MYTRRQEGVSTANTDEGRPTHTPTGDEGTKGRVRTANTDEERQKHALSRYKEAQVQLMIILGIPPHAGWIDLRGDFLSLWHEILCWISSVTRSVVVAFSGKCVKIAERYSVSRM
jgi:hypothetical protein